MLLRPCRVEDHDVPNWHVGFFTCATWMAESSPPIHAQSQPSRSTIVKLPTYPPLGIADVVTWEWNVKSRNVNPPTEICGCFLVQPRNPSHPSVPSAGQISALAGAARCNVKQVTRPQVFLSITTSIVKCMSNLKMIPNVTIKLSMSN